jgi:hypothetical protein
MKQLLLLMFIVVALFSCNSKNRTENAENMATEEIAATVIDEPVFGLDDLMAVADKEVDKEVKVTGYVTHTCIHAGKRCFIVGESQKVSIRIEAKGNIGGFNRELVGSKIEVTGILKENRLYQEDIDKREEVTNLKKQEDGSAESCEAELNNIKEMRQWMKDNNKDYYSFYYIDGRDYEVLD